MATININGMDFPSPIRGLEEIVTDAVNNSRNANGEVIGERVGRTQYKLNNLEWKWLDRDTWARMLQAMSGFFFIATIPDMVTGGWVTLKMYPGDRSAEPYYVDSSGNFTRYLSCKVNIIDCGILG